MYYYDTSYLSKVGKFEDRYNNFIKGVKMLILAINNMYLKK